MKTIVIVVATLGLLIGLAGCRSTPEHMDEGDDMMMSEESMEEESMSGMSMETVEFMVTVRVQSGSPTPLAPVAWAVHEGANPFVGGEMGKLSGLEPLAEDGDPSHIDDALAMLDRVADHGVSAEPDGSSSAGPATPGASYSFTVSAKEGQRLSFATMYVQSNDLFFSTGPEGLPLFDMSSAVNGSVTSMVILYDAGTEMNEAPGSGPSQAPRQSAPGMGMSENHPVRPVREVSDGYEYPGVGSVLEVTVHPGGTM